MSLIEPRPPFVFDADAFGTGKRMQDTSLEAHRAIQPELPKREADVLAAVLLWPDSTSYELVKLMHAADVNSVRPRLTALRDKGLVQECASRPCHVTGHRAITWRAIHRD